MRLLFSLFFLFFLFSCKQEKELPVKVATAEIQLGHHIDSIIHQNNFNGVILITQDSSIVYNKAFGYSDLESKTKLKQGDQFVIGSISKQITAAMILREFEKGHLSLEDKIGQYLPEIDQSWAQEITIHQLLTHTHGIVDTEQQLAFEPGTQFSYSQLGYGLLSQILEKITGKSFEEISMELFEELELENTFHPENKRYQHLVKGYEESEDGQLEFATNSLRNYVAAGSFISNARDLQKWNVLLHSGKIVQPATLELMKTRYATRIHPIFDQIEYGYGLLFKDGESEKQIGAFGYAPGFVSASYYYPETGMNLIVLENTAKQLHDFSITFQTATTLMELIYNEPLK